MGFRSHSDLFPRDADPLHPGPRSVSGPHASRGLAKTVLFFGDWHAAPRAQPADRPVGRSAVFRSHDSAHDDYDDRGALHPVRYSLLRDAPGRAAVVSSEGVL